jgi:[acyl-carrier-protein] S-malonyltransferase
MNCFMFPGQPLARGTWLPDDTDFVQLAEAVRSVAGFDLVRFAWLEGEGSEDLKLQLLGVTQSLYCLRQLRRQGVLPDLIAEHSMGIYPALVACDSLSETQSIEITWRVGLTLAQAAKTQAYALGCVTGLTLEPVLALAGRNLVHLANHNTSRHFLLAGKRADIISATLEAMDYGAYSARTFSCDAPLHTPLLAPLEQELHGIFAGYRYAEPCCPLMDHLDQSYLDAAEIPRFMLRELSMPVYWERTYRSLRAAGATSFFEVGVGDSLKKYNRWIEGEN